MLVRASAAESLASYQDATILPELEQVLQDPREEVDVQVYAARSFGLLADAASRPALDALIAVGRKEPQLRAALLAAGYRLGAQQYLDPLLDLLTRANETESWALLNTVQDLVESDPPSTLAADSARIRAALRTMVLRWPLTSKQVQEIEGQLPTP